MVPPQMTTQVFGVLTTQGLPQIAFDGDHLWDNEQHCNKKIINNIKGWAKPFFCWVPFSFLPTLFLFTPLTPILSMVGFPMLAKCKNTICRFIIYHTFFGHVIGTLK
jgi:hypothetical protein